MKKILKILFVCNLYFHSTTEVCSQSIFNPIQASALLGMGGQSVTMETSEAFPGNAAGLAYIKNSSFSFNGENRFIGSGIIGSSLIAGIKLSNKNAIGFGATYYGLSEYNQLNVLLGYGMRLSKRLTIGASGGVLNFTNPSRENSAYGMLHLGIQYELVSNLSIGASFHRLLSPHSRTGTLIGNDFIVGIKYSVSALVTLFAEAEKDNFSKLNLKAGVVYQIDSRFTMRSGITSYPQSFSAGIGWVLNSKMQMDAAFSFYQSLGLTPSVGLKFNLNYPAE